MQFAIVPVGGGGPLQVDVLVNMLLTAANMERLTDLEVDSIRSAAAKLALPAPAPAAGSGAGPVIEGTCSELDPSETAADE